MAQEQATDENKQTSQKPAQPSMLQSIGRGGFVLAGFALVGAALLALASNFTIDKRQQNERELVIAALNAVVPISLYNNDPLADQISVRDPLLNRSEAVTVYRMRKNGRNVAVVLEPTAPDGYSGNIKLLVGITAAGRISGVRVVTHKETPGLGDGIDSRRSNWIKQFDGNSLTQPARDDWAVQKDGGIYDSLTGATITSRAVVEAVDRALIYFDQQRELLFSKTPVTQSSNKQIGTTP